MDIELTTQQAAELFGVSTRAVQRWGQAGCPQASRNRWNLKALFTWWDENINGARVIEDETMTEIKRSYWREKAEGEKLKNAKARDEVAPWSEIEVQWAARVAVVTSGLTAFEHRLPPLLEGRSRREMQKILHDEVHYLRNSYAREGKYCPPPAGKPCPAPGKKSI